MTAKKSEFIFWTGDRLRTLRKLYRILQYELADEMNLSQEYMSKVERGKLPIPRRYGPARRTPTKYMGRIKTCFFARAYLVALVSVAKKSGAPKPDKVLELIRRFDK